MNIDWNGEGLPPVGIRVEVRRNEYSNWTPADTVGYYGDYMICAPNGGGFFGYDADEIRPIRSDKEKWIEQALKLDCEPSDGMLSRKDFCVAIYDALTSGELPIPKGD